MPERIYKTKAPPAPAAKPVRAVALVCALCLVACRAPALPAPVHTSYVWHMHQPIYWPDESTWSPWRYETAYETITLGHSQGDVYEIFNKDDRVHDYQDYPRHAISTVLDLADAAAQMSFASALVENVKSLADAGWNGGVTRRLGTTTTAPRGDGRPRATWGPATRIPLPAGRPWP